MAAKRKKPARKAAPKRAARPKATKAKAKRPQVKAAAKRPAAKVKAKAPAKTKAVPKKMVAKKAAPKAIIKAKPAVSERRTVEKAEFVSEPRIAVAEAPPTPTAQESDSGQPAAGGTAAGEAEQENSPSGLPVPIASFTI